MIGNKWSNVVPVACDCWGDLTRKYVLILVWNVTPTTVHMVKVETCSGGEGEFLKTWGGVRNFIVIALPLTLPLSCTHTHTHNTHTHAHTHTHTCTHTHVHTHTHAHTYTRIHPPTHVHTHTSTHSCTHAHTHRLFLIGAFLVLVATFMYSKPQSAAVLPQTDPKGS